MAKIPRYQGDLEAFGSNAVGQERIVFGDTGTTQSDDLTDNINSDFLRGWAALALGNKPPREWFNSVHWVSTQLSAYLHQVGVAEWHADQEYYLDSYTNYNGVLWKCVKPSGASIGVTPSGDSGDWVAIRERKVVDVRDFGAVGDGSDETAEITAAVNHWLSLLSSPYGQQYANTDAVALYFPSGVWSAPGLEILPSGTGAVIYGDGATSQLDGISIDLSQYRTNIYSLMLRGAGTYGLKISNTFGSGPKGTQVNNVWVRDRDEGLVFSGNAAWANFNNVFVEKNGTNVVMNQTSGLQLNNVIAVSPTVDDNWRITGGGEFKLNNCMGLDAIRNNLRMDGSTASNVVEHYFTQCTFTVARKNRVINISGISDSGGKAFVTCSADHELVPGMDNIDLDGVVYGGNYDVFDVVSPTEFILDTAFVGVETNITASLPNWDVYIDVNPGDPIARTNDQYFIGGNINYLKVNRGYNINFEGTRLKSQIWINEGHRINFNRSSRGRVSGDFDNLPIGGTATGWTDFVKSDDSESIIPGQNRISMIAPDAASGLGANNLPVFLNEVSSSEVGARIKSKGRIYSMNEEGITIESVVTSKTTIGDDSVFSIDAPQQSGTVRVGPADNQANFWGWYAFKAGGGTGDAQQIAGGANADGASGVLTGTTGADGNVTVSAATDGKVYIENRSGSSLDFSFIFEGVE